jgi:hypothetical protein
MSDRSTIADDRRRIDVSLSIITATHAIERQRLDGENLRQFRARALAILDRLEDRARAYPDLAQRLAALRRDLASG